MAHSPHIAKFSLGEKIWIFANLSGMVCYLALAFNIWPPADEIHLPAGPGDPIVWVMTVFPVLAIFTLANFVWLIKILFRIRRPENKRQMLLWILISLTWIAVNRYDAHRQSTPSQSSTLVYSKRRMG